MSAVTAWLLAARPKTLGLSVSPVVLGTALAWAETGSFQPGPAWLALCVALFLQIGVNLHNDAADFETGNDKADRLGPERAAAAGWLTARQLKTAAMLCFVLALLAGVGLLLRGGWPVFWLGVACLLAGAAYSGGPWPVSHSPLGELFVWAFFGLAAVNGSYYIQVLDLSVASWLAGNALGLLAAAVLVVNNHRDRQSDARVGRRTLAVLTPLWASRVEYALLLFGGLLSLLFVRPSAMLWGLAPLWIMAAILARRMWRWPVTARLNRLLADTARFQVLTAFLCAALLILFP